MAERMAGRVAFITGAARGQGRSHAVRLAAEGADIIAIDACADVGSASYAMATEQDLEETARLVAEQGRRAVARKADVRDFDALQAAFDAGVAELGPVHTVLANAGIVSFAPTWELTAQHWQDMIDINLTGVFHTAKVAIPGMIEHGAGGCLLFTSSIGGFKGMQTIGHYVAAKHGIVGLMRTLANELGPHGIRVNTIHPTNVDTPMIQHEGAMGLFVPEGVEPTRENAMPGYRSLNAMPVPWAEVGDVSNAVAFLASDEARYITGATFPVDAGANVK